MSDFPMNGIDLGTTYPDWGTDPNWTTDSTWGIDNVPNWGIDDWGIDFGGGGGTTGGDTGFWNQGLGGNILGGLTDFGIAGLNAGMGISAMNQAQQAAQVQAERAAQATRKGNIWSAGLQRLADDTEYARQRDAKLFNIAHLNDPNVLWDQERTMLRSAAVAGVKPQDAAYYAFIT